MNILFVGTNVPDEIEYQVKNISAAGNRFQNNFIRNLKQGGHQVKSAAFLAVPFDRDLLQKATTDHDYQYEMSQTGVRGLHSSLRRFKKLVNNLLEEADCVMCYNMTYAWLWLASMAKHKGKKSVIILADYSGPESFQSWKQKLYANFQKKSIQQFEIVVGLSAKTKEFLKNNQRFICMEGGIEDSFYNALEHLIPSLDRPIRMVYSGLLNHVTGVQLFIESMKRIAESNPGQYEVVISGKGDMANWIENEARGAEWLIYKGHLPYEAYQKLIREADVLVNPRDMRLPENANNFPSKVLDYLATGNEMISTKFAGYEKFEPYAHFIDVTNMEAELKKCLESILQQSDEERIKAYEARRKFVKAFLWKNQIQRILSEINAGD